MNEIPHCPSCHHALTRVDHYGIEHLILDDSVYRPVNVEEGLASEVDLRCGFCALPLPREMREFFYRRWYAVIEATREQHR